MQVNRPKERKRLKRAGEGRQANDADEMRAELFGGDGKYNIDLSVTGTLTAIQQTALFAVQFPHR
jgi:hypothetical protein